MDGPLRGPALCHKHVERQVITFTDAVHNENALRGQKIVLSSNCLLSWQYAMLSAPLWTGSGSVAGA